MSVMSSIDSQIYELLHTTEWTYEKIAEYVGVPVHWVSEAAEAEFISQLYHHEPDY